MQLMAVSACLGGASAVGGRCMPPARLQLHDERSEELGRAAVECLHALHHLAVEVHLYLHLDVTRQLPKQRQQVRASAAPKSDPAATKPPVRSRFIRSRLARSCFVRSRFIRSCFVRSRLVRSRLVSSRLITSRQPNESGCDYSCPLRVTCVSPHAAGGRGLDGGGCDLAGDHRDLTVTRLLAYWLPRPRSYSR